MPHVNCQALLAVELLQCTALILPQQQLLQSSCDAVVFAPVACNSWQRVIFEMLSTAK